ncbi:hypothetical protein B0H66DRAFT_109977 [Apodospora peruviana]|uniref:Fungal STAND N-terminal Goodbye domain-containing protein n=1 Tax=Apodospora peruviana TaxID=516989 RepID=A0AAE0MAK5_9PEZI|nr:hypothetical protein B0H66DRAFT_109977 [Apodospora peruviana]
MARDSEKVDSIVNRYLFERQEEMEEIHDAFGVKPPQADAPEPAWDSERSRDFLQVVDKYNTYLDQVSREFNFNAKACSWSVVLEKLQEANEALGKRIRRDKVIWLKGGVVLSHAASILQPVLQGIPNEAYGLSAGLGLIFHLAKDRDKAKHGIVNVFEDVARTFAIAGDAVESCAENHVEAAQLNDALDRLQITLFESIPSLIHTLVPDSTTQWLAAPFRGYRTEKLLESIRIDIKRVEARARTISEHFTKDHVKEIHSGVRGLHEQFQGLDERQQDILDTVNYALASQHGMTKMLHEVVELFNYFREQSSSPSTAASTAPPPSVSVASSRTFAFGPSSPLTQLPPDTKLPALKYILGIHDHSHVAKDLAYIARQEHSFDKKAMLSVSSIILNPHFQRWMTVDGSDFIYLVGRLERSYGKTSPISYFCAQFVNKLKESAPPTTITLHFFCGQHVAATDSLRSPRGLMRSLIAQFLRAWPHVSLDGMDLSALNGISHEALSIDDFCYLLEMVVRQVPPQYTVNCVIDDVNRLERDDIAEWRAEYDSVMNSLWRMGRTAAAAEGGEMPRFKVLITSPARSKWLRGENEVPEDHRVFVTDNGFSSCCR